MHQLIKNILFISIIDYLVQFLADISYFIWKVILLPPGFYNFWTVIILNHNKIFPNRRNRTFPKFESELSIRSWKMRVQLIVINFSFNNFRIVRWCRLPSIWPFRGIWVPPICRCCGGRWWGYCRPLPYVLRPLRLRPPHVIRLLRRRGRFATPVAISGNGIYGSIWRCRVSC